MKLETFKFLTAVEIFLLSPDGSEVLLIHRSKNKEYLPDYYAGLGGKMDSPENETPLEAAYREVKEESGYDPEDITGMKLNAVITVYDRFGKWIVYDFVGQVKKKKFDKEEIINEGTLEWKKLGRLDDLKLIQDLRNGILEKIIGTDKFLWLKSVYDLNDNLAHFEITAETEK